jgi:hypothetical protein
MCSGFDWLGRECDHGTLNFQDFNQLFVLLVIYAENHLMGPEGEIITISHQVLEHLDLVEVGKKLSL